MLNALLKPSGRTGPGLLLALALAVPVHAESPPPAISVVGEAEIAVKPDRAEVSIGVITQADTAVKAVTENSAAIRSLQSRLAQDFALTEADVQTTQFAVSPRYNFENQKQILLGYEVQHILSIKLSELERLGQLLDVVVQLGANQIQGVSYGSSQAATLSDQARTAAVAEARRKAELYALAAEREVGCMLQLSETTASPVPAFAMRMAVADAASAVPVAPGQIKVSASVQVSFALGADAAACQ
jgi:uncharacterized protein